VLPEPDVSPVDPPVDPEVDPVVEPVVGELVVPELVEEEMGVLDVVPVSVDATTAPSFDWRLRARLRSFERTLRVGVLGSGRLWIARAGIGSAAKLSSPIRPVIITGSSTTCATAVGWGGEPPIAPASTTPASTRRRSITTVFPTKKTSSRSMIRSLLAWFFINHQGSTFYGSSDRKRDDRRLIVEPRGLRDTPHQGEVSYGI
jgi:hypothetical protein